MDREGASDVERLQDRIAILEDILGIGRSQISRIRSVLGLSPSEAKVLGMILNRSLVTREAIYCMLYGSRPDCDQVGFKTIDVFIFKVRKKLRAFGIEFTMLRADGYVMSSASKAKIRSMLAEHAAEDAKLPDDGASPRATARYRPASFGSLSNAAAL